MSDIDDTQHCPSCEALANERDRWRKAVRELVTMLANSGADFAPFWTENILEKYSLTLGAEK